MRVLVATETRFVRDPDGRVYSRFGVDGYGFWQRYLDVFDGVVVAARTSTVGSAEGLLPVEGPGVEVAPLPDYRGPWGYVRQHAALRSAMRLAVSRADVLCLRAPGPIPACAWRTRQGRPFGVEVVGDPFDALARNTVRSAVRPLARILLAARLRAMCREAAAVAYVTQAALQRRYPTRAWAISYSSIDLGDDAFASDEDLARRCAAARDATKGSSCAPWRLVCVGSLAQPYKGQDVLIEALGRCRALGLCVDLTLVGDGDHRAALEKLADRLCLRPWVHFAGQVRAGASVRALLDAADLFVLPSRTEGLPRALVEAMARGLPSIASRVGGIPELLPDDRLVPPGDAKALAAAIATLCSPVTDLPGIARRDRMVAGRFAARVLRPRRIELYQRLYAVADLRSPHPYRNGAGAQQPGLAAASAASSQV